MRALNSDRKLRLFLPYLIRPRSSRIPTSAFVVPMSESAQLSKRPQFSANRIGSPSNDASCTVQFPKISCLQFIKPQNEIQEFFKSILSEQHLLSVRIIHEAVISVKNIGPPLTNKILFQNLASGKCLRTKILSASQVKGAYRLGSRADEQKTKLCHTRMIARNKKFWCT